MQATIVWTCAAAAATAREAYFNSLQGPWSFSLKWAYSVRVLLRHNFCSLISLTGICAWVSVEMRVLCAVVCLPAQSCSSTSSAGAGCNWHFFHIATAYESMCKVHDMNWSKGLRLVLCVNLCLQPLANLACATKNSSVRGNKGLADRIVLACNSFHFDTAV